jgi:hypothetical protein
MHVQYNGCRWRGSTMHIAVAKQHYMQKLKEQWESEAAEEEAEKEAAAQELVPQVPEELKVSGQTLVLRLKHPHKRDKVSALAARVPLPPQAVCTHVSAPRGSPRHSVQRCTLRLVRYASSMHTAR